MCQLYKDNSIPAGTIKQIRWLCTRSEAAEKARNSATGAPTYVTLQVSLLGHDATARLHKQGAVVSGAFCRVFDYKVHSHA